MSIAIYNSSGQSFIAHRQNYYTIELMEFIGDALNVVKVSANGLELTDILNTFNVPKLMSDFESGYHKSPRYYNVSWFGDHARFIAGNINHLLF